MPTISSDKACSNNNNKTSVELVEAFRVVWMEPSLEARQGALEKA